MQKYIKCADHLLYPFTENYKLARVESKVAIKNTPDVYKPVDSKKDKNFFRNDWTVLGFRAFKQLQRILPKRCNMCIVGTGGGLDALGAIEILNPKSLLVTDLSDAALNQSEKNILNNLKEEHTSKLHREARHSFLYNDFRSTDCAFDFMYENLPNLPLSKVKKNMKSEQPITASYYFKKEILENVPKKISDNLLTLHWLFLKSAKKYLKKDGRVLCSIGGRIEYSVIEQMFREAGFEPELVIYDFKRQNEAESNLPGYASEEKKRKGKVKFSYYNYKEVLNKITKVKYDKLKGFAGNMSLLKSILKAKELSAQQAFRTFKENKTEIGHEVFFVLGKPFNK